MNVNLKVEIIKKFGTQADFAMAVRVNESLVSRVVRRRRSIPPETQEQWADALGCDVADIFGEA
ncbi:MAG: XRE family transcriptional regulator [Desulfobacterales bacterium]